MVHEAGRAADVDMGTGSGHPQSCPDIKLLLARLGIEVKLHALRKRCSLNGIDERSPRP